MSSWKSSIAGYRTSSTARRQAVDLVDEQHVAVVEVGEDRGEVAGPLERRAAVTRRPTPISAATMPASVVLPRPGGPANSRWSTAWPPAPRRLEQDLEVLLQLRLADELVEAARPERDLLGRLVGLGRGAEQLVSRAHRVAASRRPRAA